MKPLFDDKFLEDMADMGIEVTDVFYHLGTAVIAYKDHRKCGKRRMVMRNYPSAFDKLADTCIGE